MSGSPFGVRVVRVEESSQAHQADVRAGDIIVSIDGKEIPSIDEFALLSNALKGRTTSAHVLLFRNGAPREITVHLYSYPVLRAWGIEWVPDHDIRFAQAETGRDYWIRLGRGFEEARNPTQALDAYLNALHNVPDDVATALAANRLFFEIAQRQLGDRQLSPGIASLRQALTMADRLFNHPLTEEHLRTLRQQLQDTLGALRAFSADIHGGAHSE